MYICEICGRLYDGEFGTHIECHGHSSYYNEVVDNEPECGTCGGYYVEATRCAICGEWFNDEYGLGVCECCLDKEKTFENACKIWEQDKTEVDIVPVVAYALGNEKINEILVEYLTAHREEYAEEIKNYIDENIEYLADILKERKENRNGRHTN